MRDEAEIVGWDKNLQEYQERRRSADRFLGFVRSVARGVTAPEDYFVKTEPLVAVDQGLLIGIPVGALLQHMVNQEIHSLVSSIKDGGFDEPSATSNEI